MNLRTWDRIVQLCDFPRFRGESRPLATAKADRADTYKQPPSAKADEPSAAASLGNLTGEMTYGFGPGRGCSAPQQLFYVTIVYLAR